VPRRTSEAGSGTCASTTAKLNDGLMFQSVALKNVTFKASPGMPVIGSSSVTEPFHVFGAPAQIRQSVSPELGDTPSPAAHARMAPEYLAVKRPVSVKVGTECPATVKPENVSVIVSVSIFPTQPAPEQVLCGESVKP
jgi:hypothetical protein